MNSMKKEVVSMGPVGINVEEMKKFAEIHKAELETQPLPVPGRRGTKGVKIARAEKVPESSTAVVAEFEVGGVKYSVYY